MEDFNSCEYSTEQKIEGKWLALRLFFVFFYIAFATAYFALIYVTRIFTLGALIPLAVWILVFFTWRYTCPDYKYEISSATLRFYVTYRKTCKERLKIKISEAVAILPIDSMNEKIMEFAPKKVFSSLPSKSCKDKYAILFSDEKGKRCAFLFVATKEAVRLLSVYNSKTVKT